MNRLPYNYPKQVKVVLIAETLLVFGACTIAWFFWSTLCPTGIESCLGNDSTLRPLIFIFLAAFRPFVFTPLFFLTIIAGRAFGPFWGAILAALGGVLSCYLVFIVSRVFGGSLVKPWLRANLPATYKLLQSQDYKIVIALRLIPFIPFDLVSMSLGALSLRTKTVMLCTFLAIIPECYVFARLVDPNGSMLGAAVVSLLVFGASLIGPLLLVEIKMRNQGRSLLSMLRASFNEIKFEIQANNDIMRSDHFDKQKTPVLLLYGFFSSRRSVTVLEKMLKSRGHQVFSFNLGGLLNTFFTRDILDTASFIDLKIKRQIDRHGFKKIHIVAHSKGGLVALWWLLKLGGHHHCDKVVTMGTPFRGSRLTYIALITPLGFFWRDVGQMRPGSTFLKTLHKAAVPENLKIYCLYSQNDRVARGEAGIFAPDPPSSQVTPVAMNHISHFEFLYRKEVSKRISLLLADEAVPTEEQATMDSSESAESLDPQEQVWRQIAGDE